MTYLHINTNHYANVLRVRKSIGSDGIIAAIKRQLKNTLYTTKKVLPK